MNTSTINNLSKKLFPILICFTLLFPLVKENISSFSIILLGINLVIYKIAAKDFSFIKSDTLLLTLPFWIVLCASFFSSNLEISLTHLQHALFFLIVPIIFGLIPKEFFVPKMINLYLSFLKNICFLVIIIYVIGYFNSITFWKLRLGYYEYSDFRDYVYNEFTIFKIHPTYLTSILVLVTAQSYELVLMRKKYLQLVYIFVFVTTTFLLLTRLNIILLVSCLLFMTLFRSSLNLKYRIVLGFSLITLVVFLVIYVPGISIRFSETIKSFNIKPKDLAYNSTNIRKAILDCDLKIAKENWVKGIGYENLQNSLNDCYKSNYKSSFYLDHNYMTHNYYLYTLISSGILGFIIYLIYIFNLIKISLKKKSFLLNVLLINTLIICVVEDYFFRQHGSLYFNVLLMIFIRYHENKKTSYESI